MKEELYEFLIGVGGYTIDQIKKMTPLQQTVTIRALSKFPKGPFNV